MLWTSVSKRYTTSTCGPSSRAPCRRINNQGTQGDVPVAIPKTIPGNKNSCNDIAWASTFPQVTNFLYLYYSDARVVDRHWIPLMRHTENLITDASKPPNALAV